MLVKPGLIKGYFDPLQVNLPMKNDLLGKLSGSPTFTRGSKQWVTSFEGVLRPVYNDCPAFEGTRIVTNWVSNSNASPTLLNTATWDSATNTVSFPAVNDQAYFLAVNPFGTAQLIGCVVVISVELKASVNGTVSIDATGPLPTGTKQVAVTTSWQRFSIILGPITAGNSCSPRVIRKVGDTLTSLQIRNVQLEYVTGASNQNPSEYVATTTAPVTKCFDYLNGNTVDANGVVTEAKGANIAARRWPTVANNALCTAYSDNSQGQNSTVTAVSGGFELKRNSNTEYPAIKFPALVIGKQYEVTIQVAAISGYSINGSIRTNNAPMLTFTAAGTYTTTFTAQSVSTNNAILASQAGAGFFVSVDSLRLAEDTELVTNGDFSVSTGWGNTGGWTFDTVAGVASNTGNTGSLYRPMGLKPGKTYEIIIDISSYTSGQIDFRAGGVSGNTSAMASVGVFKKIFTPGTTANGDGVIFSTAFVGSVNSVSVKEITYPASLNQGLLLEPTATNKCTAYGAIPGDVLGADAITVAADKDFSSDTGFWTKGAGVTISGGLATWTTSSQALYRTNLLVRGRVYQVTYTVTGRTAGSVRFVDGTWRSADGTYTENILLVSTNGAEFWGNNFSGSIDNVTIKEVVLAVGTKAFGLNGSAISGLATTGYTQTSGNLVVGAQYKIVQRGGTPLDWSTCATLVSGSANTVGAVYNVTSAGTLASGDQADNLSVNISIVDATAELASAGLLGINPSGKVYKVDNTLGSQTFFITCSGSLGSTNACSISTYCKCGDSTNSYGLRLSATTFGTSGMVTGNTTWQRIAKENIYSAGVAPVVGDSVQFQVPAGKVFYFILPQLEELAYKTSPIPVSGSTAQRALGTCSFPVLNNVKNNDFSVYFEAATPTPTTSPGTAMFDINNTNANRLLFYKGAAGTISIYKTIGAVDYNSTGTTTAMVANVTSKFALSMSSATGYTVFKDGVKITGNANTANIPFNTVTFNTYNPIVLNIKNVRIYRKPLSDAQLIAMTTP